MKHVILGTAGHIDHGRPLCQGPDRVDTDRLKEEKERGITIELGSPYLDSRAGFDWNRRCSARKIVKTHGAGAWGLISLHWLLRQTKGVIPDEGTPRYLQSSQGKERSGHSHEDRSCDHELLDLVKEEVMENSPADLLGWRPILSYRRQRRSIPTDCTLDIFEGD